MYVDIPCGVDRVVCDFPPADPERLRDSRLGEHRSFSLRVVGRDGRLYQLRTTAPRLAGWLAGWLASWLAHYLIIGQ